MPAQISPRELKQRIERGDHLVVLDVREPEEWALARLAVAVHIPMGEIAGRLHEIDPDQEIVVVCHHGIRSAQVASFLAQRDFPRVLNLAGGIDSWSLTVDPSVPRY
ncbi:MAG TPA: rhodanese-like domain-containing protein [Candidatus Kryptonia bacterium]|nr:rhodanese-like domain-containing protein [Candidatus Kryptonia bacterium]